VLLIVSGVAYVEPVSAKPLGGAAASDPFAAFVAEASQRFGIPASWIRAVMQVESVGDVRALSARGAMGLMQIMPQTWSGLRLR
jgi:soluble lytic murein transglycosylase-like protein